MDITAAEVVVGTTAAVEPAVGTPEVAEVVVVTPAVGAATPVAVIAKKFVTSSYDHDVSSSLLTMK